VVTLGIHIERAGPGRVVAFDGARATLDSPAPFPPGATVRAEVQEGSAALSVKVHHCKRSSADRFVIVGRVQNATRTLLELLRTLPPTTDP
jgi:acyl dehydratase